MGSERIDKLDLMILKTLELAPLHGYGVGQRIEQTSGGVIKTTLGALYPALQRLERTGLVKGEWLASDSNRRARYYSLTPKGRRRLTAGCRAWEENMAAVARVLASDPTPR